MFTEDTRTETFLTQMGVKYSYTNNLHLSELQPGWDVVNDGRPVPKRETAILDYASLMESGSPAPAVIIQRDKGKVIVLDGVQRLGAAILADFTRFSAYVVECDSEDTLAAIRVMANVRLQGHAEKAEWTKRNAVLRLVIDRGMSPAEVAQLGGWNKSDIERLSTVLEWGFHIRCIGGPSHLSDGIVKHISELTTQESMHAAHKPIAKFLNCVESAKLSTSDAVPYLDDFFSPITKRSIAAEKYSERLHAFMSEPEIDTRLHGRQSPGISADVNLRRSMKTCISILDRLTEEGDNLRYIDEFFKLNKQINSRLRNLAHHCQRPDMPRTPADKWAKHE